MARRILFKKRKKRVFFDDVKEQSAGLAEKKYSAWKLNQVNEGIIEELKKMSEIMPERALQGFVMMSIGQELLKRLARPKDYRTAIKINSALVRTIKAVDDIKRGKISKILLQKVIKDGIKVFRGFSEKEKVDYLKEKEKKIAKIMLESIPIQGESKNYLEIIVDDIYKHYFNLLCNLLGIKNTAIFDILEKRMASEFLKKI